MKKIDITDADFIKMIKKVYELSTPQGLGFLHFDAAPLSDEEASSFINPDGTIHMDYVKGRSCKFNVFKNAEDNTFFMYFPWYDHTDNQLEELLNSLNISTDIENLQHNLSCNCRDCVSKRI